MADLRHPSANDPVYLRQIAEDEHDYDFDRVPQDEYAIDGQASGRNLATPSPRSAHDAGNAASHNSPARLAGGPLSNTPSELIASMTTAYEALDHARDVLDDINPRGSILRNELSSLRWKTRRLLRDTKDEYR